MGGRGKAYTVINKLPNYSRAVFPRNKFKNYILNPSKDKDKAEFFSSIGYNMKNYERLQQEIQRKLKTNKALQYTTDEKGNTAYQVNMKLGLTDRRMVTTAWIIRKGETVPQFVSAYSNKKLNKRK